MHATAVGAQRVIINPFILTNVDLEGINVY